MLLEELHLREVLPLPVTGVLLLQLLELRLDPLHLLHGLHALVLQRESEDLHRQREQDDGDAPVVGRNHPIEELHDPEQQLGDHRPESQIDRLLQGLSHRRELGLALRASVALEKLWESPPAATCTGTMSVLISAPDFSPCASSRQEAGTPAGGMTALRKYCSSMPANWAEGASNTGCFAPMATRSTLLLFAAQMVRAGVLLCGVRNPPWGSSACVPWRTESCPWT